MGCARVFRLGNSVYVELPVAVLVAMFAPDLWFTFPNQCHHLYSGTSTQTGPVTGHEQNTSGSGNHWTLSEAATPALL